MQEAEYDFAVIGGGSGGYAAARTAHSLGLRVCVIDGADELGGLCILRGCMPSKTLLETADRNIVIRRAAEYGLIAEPVGVDVRAIRDRKRRLIGGFAEYRQGQLQDGRWTLHRGYASFVDRHSARVKLRNSSDTLLVRSKTWCIATGSVANIPPIAGLKEAGYWTSDELLEAERLPESFAILGGGAIALEAAHYLEGLGRNVTIIQRGSQMLSGLDRECSDVLCDAYAKRGIQSYCGTNIHSVKLENGRKVIHFSHGEDAKTLAVDEVLVALGRVPATGGLNLHAAHVACMDHPACDPGIKIMVAPTMQTSQEHIFAAGDVCSVLDVVHVAIQQGEIAARNAHRLLHGQHPLEHMDHRLLLFGVFSQPQVAVVGAKEAELKKQGTPYVAASYPFDDHGKSMVMGECEGFVKMLAHRHTGEILGASCVGPEATELIHEVVVAMFHGCTVQRFMTIPHYHPTLSEIWTYPAEECADQIAAARDTSAA